jgi:hypothetical protein
MSSDDSRNDLVARARERANAPLQPEAWGYRVGLDPGDVFAGRWRGETIDEANNNRRVYLLWDDDDEPCWHRHYTALGREIDRVQPNVGDTVVIARGDDYPTGYDNPGQAYGVECGPCDRPVPGSSSQDEDDEVPF